MIQESVLVKNIPDVIAKAHAMAVEKGWWDNPDRPWAEQHNNFYGEVAEAWEEYRAGRMNIWFEPMGNGTAFGDKPEGFWVEIADLLIRMGDTLGKYKVVTLLLDHDSGKIKDDVSFIANLYRELAKIAAGPDGDFRNMLDVSSWIFSDCFNYAKKSGVDLYDIISVKMSYNQTRSRRHGNKKA